MIRQIIPTTNVAWSNSPSGASAWKTTRNKVYLWTAVAICLILWWYLLKAFAIQRLHGFWEPLLSYHEVFFPPTNLCHYNMFFPLPVMWQVANKSMFLTLLLKVTLEDTDPHTQSRRHQSQHFPSSSVVHLKALTHLLGYLLGMLTRAERAIITLQFQNMAFSDSCFLKIQRNQAFQFSSAWNTSNGECEQLLCMGSLFFQDCLWLSNAMIWVICSAAEVTDIREEKAKHGGDRLYNACSRKENGDNQEWSTWMIAGGKEGEKGAYGNISLPT